MDCEICEQPHSKFTCANCTSSRIREFKDQLKHLTTERDARRDLTAKALNLVQEQRSQKAIIATTEARIKELRQQRDELRKRNDKAKSRVASTRTQLATRRANLLTARSFAPHNLKEPTNDWASGIDDLNHHVVKARASLIEELQEAFDLVETEVRTAKPSGLAGSMLFAFPRVGYAASHLEWTIAGLRLPPHKELTRLPPEEVNAALLHTLHFLRVICMYLGVKLPFEVTWSGDRVGVGVPSLSAGPGTSSGNWSKWTSLCPLQLPVAGANQMLPNPTNHADIFALAFCMLAYNVCYLAYTQTVSIPLHQTGDILCNLWTVCSSSNIGRFSHQTSSSSADVIRAASSQFSPMPTPMGMSSGMVYPPHHGRMLAAPTTSAFQLDFDSMVEHITGKKLKPPPDRTSRKRSARELSTLLEDENGDGWDLIERDEEDFSTKGQ